MACRIIQAYCIHLYVYICTFVHVCIHIHIIYIYAELCLVALSCLTLCNPMDCSPAGSSVHEDSLGKNTEVGCHTLLQGIFPTQELISYFSHTEPLCEGYKQKPGASSITIPISISMKTPSSRCPTTCKPMSAYIRYCNFYSVSTKSDKDSQTLGADTNLNTFLDTHNLKRYLDIWIDI